MLAEYPFDLGIDANPDIVSVTCHCASEQVDSINLWFKRGMVWYYGFNHEEAIECFQQILHIDATCAMAHWGISLSHGPNYNVKYMELDSFPSATEAWKHAKKSFDIVKMHPTTWPEQEKCLIEALQCRYNEIPPGDNTEQISQNSPEYAHALRGVYHLYPTDPCVAALFAESLLNLDPWKLYDPHSQAPRPFTVEAVAVIHAGLQVSPQHPGLLHFLVHVLEMSPTPNLGLPYTPTLRRSFPDAGHLIHMASHLSCVLGQWQEVVEVNAQARGADERYLAFRGRRSYYVGYCCHNLLFSVYGGMMAGG